MGCASLAVTGLSFFADPAVSWQKMLQMDALAVKNCMSVQMHTLNPLAFSYRSFCLFCFGPLATTTRQARRLYACLSVLLPRVGQPTVHRVAPTVAALCDSAIAVCCHPSFSLLAQGKEENGGSNDGGPYMSPS
jgi:hypothetical protein